MKISQGKVDKNQPKVELWSTKHTSGLNSSRNTTPISRKDKSKSFTIRALTRQRLAEQVERGGSLSTGTGMASTPKQAQSSNAKIVSSGATPNESERGGNASGEAKCEAKRETETHVEPVASATCENENRHQNVNAGKIQDDVGKSQPNLKQTPSETYGKRDRDSVSPQGEEMQKCPKFTLNELHDEEWENSLEFFDESAMDGKGLEE